MADQTIISAEDLVVTGNLKVSGSQVSTTSTDTEIKDNIITLNKGGTLTASGSGFVIESGGSNAASLVSKLVDGILEIKILQHQVQFQVQSV